jgi:hypothetical protein
MPTHEARARPGDITLRPVRGEFSVCQIPVDSPWPVPARAQSLFSVSRTAREISIVCDADEAPAGARVEPGWRCLEVVGPLDFQLVGVLAGLTRCLASAGVSVFVISTYDTDLILVREHDLEPAMTALAQSGYAFDPGSGTVPMSSGNSG